MDQPGLAEPAHFAALRALGRVNWLSRTASVIGRAMLRHMAPTGNGPIAVLDLASGGGDVAIALARWAARHGAPVRIQGLDFSRTAVKFAAQRAQDAGIFNVQFAHCNVLEEPLPAQFDVIMCSAFLHHLESDAALRLLEKMASATRRMVLVDDLRRTRQGYMLAWLGCRLLSRSPVVRQDGPQSVAAAFTASEARSLAERAGLHGAQVTCHWPQRFLLTWSRM